MNSLVIIITAWLSFLGWAVGEILLAQPTSRFSRWGLGVWSAGAVILVIHLGFAFAGRHDWSHASAVAETARQTEEAFGLRWGGGVWFNYLLAGWWVAEAIRQWRRPWDEPGLVVQRVTRRVFFWVMWFNGAFVFAQGPRRWMALVICLAVLVAWWGAGRRGDSVQRGPHGIR